MLRKALMAASILLASGSALAHEGYVSGRVVRVEPSLSVSINGGQYNDGYRVLYESGGQRYWTHSDYRPRGVIYVPRPIQVQPVYYTQSYYSGNSGHHYGWGNRHDRHEEWREHHRDEDEDHDRRRGHHWRDDD